jgi:hypothetical protein
MPMDWGLARDYAARDGCAEETFVTEAEWLAAADPRLMLDFLRERGRASKRKLTLFACAGCRRISGGNCGGIGSRWALRTVRTAERWADGEVAAEQLAELKRLIDSDDAQSSANDVARFLVRPLAWEAAVEATFIPRDIAFRVIRFGGIDYDPAERRKHTEQVALCRLILDIFGNPSDRAPAEALTGRMPHGDTVQRLSAAAYKARTTPYGHLSETGVKLLADALEDAGCTDADLLGHLRGPGPHVRGCWALDLVLAKG